MQRPEVLVSQKGKYYAIECVCLSVAKKEIITQHTLTTNTSTHTLQKIKNIKPGCRLALVFSYFPFSLGGWLYFRSPYALLGVLYVEA